MSDTPSFSTLRTRHSELLRQSSQGAVAPDFLKEIRSFVEAVRLAGREVVDEDDRDYLRSLLTFWGNWLYNQTRTYPDTNLELFTPEAAAAWGKKVAETIVRPVTVGADPAQRNRLIAGAIGAVILVTLTVLLLGGLAGLLMTRMASQMEQLTLPVEQTVEALSTTLSAPTGTPLPTTPAPTPVPTETLPPTAEIEVTALPTATSTRPAIPTPVGTPPQTLPSEVPTELPSTGGGGDGLPPVGILSVQVLEPESGREVAVGEPFTISASFYNLQSGWQLFFVLTQFDTAESVILTDSLPIQNDGATGAVSARAVLGEPGGYTVGIYIATSQEEIQRLTRWAQAGVSVPPEVEYNGVIVFRDLTFFEVR